MADENPERSKLRLKIEHAQTAERQAFAAYHEAMAAAFRDGKKAEKVFNKVASKKGLARAHNEIEKAANGRMFGKRREQDASAQAIKDLRTRDAEVTETRQAHEAAKRALIDHDRVSARKNQKKLELPPKPKVKSISDLKKLNKTKSGRGFRRRVREDERER